MSNKGNSIGSGIIGGGSGSGGITIGAAVSGGTPSTLLWVDSGGLLQSGATASPIVTGTINWGGTTNMVLSANTSWWNFSYSGQAANGAGSATQPFVAVGPIGAGNTGFGATTAGGIFFSRGAATQSVVLNSVSGVGLTLSGGQTLGFSAAAALTGANPAAENAQDTAIAARVAAGIWGPSAGSWMQNTSGEAALAGNYTNATATFSNTALSRTVISGRTYNFECNLFISESTAADGWQLDFNGGTAAMTNFVANAVSTAETGIIVVLAAATSAALATVINATTTVTTGGQMIQIRGSFVPSGNGTFILRAAQNTHSTGTLTIKRGSNMILRDSPAL